MVLVAIFGLLGVVSRLLVEDLHSAQLQAGAARSSGKFTNLSADVLNRSFTEPFELWHRNREILAATVSGPEWVALSLAYAEGLGLLRDLVVNRPGSDGVEDAAIPDWVKFLFLTAETRMAPGIAFCRSTAAGSITTSRIPCGALSNRLRRASIRLTVERKTAPGRDERCRQQQPTSAITEVAGSVRQAARMPTEQNRHSGGLTRQDSPRSGEGRNGEMDADDIRSTMTLPGARIPSATVLGTTHLPSPRPPHQRRHHSGAGYYRSLGGESGDQRGVAHGSIR